jgi:putative endonuclease
VSAVYMLASQPYGTLYIGVTADIVLRMSQHRSGEIAGFTARYGIRRLVWFERHDRIVDAIQREKSLKKYKRQWKINLIERDNPHWEDLYPAFFRVEGPLSHLQPRV